jgi:hypothetical protein
MKRRGFLQHMFFGASATSLLPVEAAMTNTINPTVANKDITAEIEALLHQTEAIWDSQDTAALRDLWDTDDAEPFYLAGEQDDWFVGWDAINAYLAPPPGSPKITQARSGFVSMISARGCWHRIWHSVHFGCAQT